MAHKNYKKNTSPPVKKTPAKKGGNTTPPKHQPKTGKKNNLHLFTFIFIAVCGMFLYSNTVNHDFVLDDFSVIAENTITTGGMDTISTVFKTGYRQGNFTVEDNLYRPLTKAMFTVEYDLSGGKPYYQQSGGKPFLMHFINVILYGLLCGFIFLTLRRFIPGQYYLALVTTLLFTFHPIHTEVVANIKSRDEIVALFLLLGSLWFVKSYVDKNKIVDLILAIFIYFFALFAKESTITYVALAPITMYFLTSAKWPKILTVSVFMLAVTGIYLLIHRSVIGSIGLVTELIPVPDNSIMESKDFGVRKMTAIEILGRYLKLMFIPHPLSSDYSFATIPLVKSAANPGFIAAFLIHIGLLVYAIMGFRKRSIASFAIFFYFITISIVSNLFIYIGTNMAERLVFIPSLGFCLLIAFFIIKLLKLEKTTPQLIQDVFTQKALLWLILVPLLIIGTVKTIDRNQDWKNVSTLFNADIKTVPNSVHMLLYHAGMITNTDSLALKDSTQKIITLRLAEKELLKADSLWEPFPNGHSLLGRVYKEMGEYYAARRKGVQAGELYNLAIKHYKRTLELNAKDPTTFNNYATCYFAVGRYDSAEVNFKKAIDITPICYADALANLGSVYGTYGNIARSQGKMEEDKGNVAGAQQKYQEANKFFSMAIDMFNQTLVCDPNNIPANQFMAMTYINLGDQAKAAPYTQRYNELMQKKQERLNQFKN